LLFATAATRVEPVAIAGFGIPQLTLNTANTGSVNSGCRSDLVAIDGRPVAVRVTGPVASAQTTAALTVTPCRGAISLGAGAHVLTTALGKDVGLSVDRLVLASGAAAATVAVADGHVRVAPSGAASTAPTPAVSVVHNGATNLRVHVTGAQNKFWLVLGESQSPGWHAHVVHGGDLGSSQLVDGYANGWLVSPPASGSFDVVFEWTPQRQVWGAIWLSLLGALICLAIIGVTWRRRAVMVTAATPRPGDADVDLAWSAGDRSAPGAGGHPRLRWLGPLLTGVIAGLVVAPWVGVLVAAITFAVITRPRLRPWVMLGPGALLALCALYIVVEQHRYGYPSVFEWPTVFPHARTLAWIAVVLLAADAVVEVLRSRAGRGPIAEKEPGPGPDPT